MVNYMALDLRGLGYLVDENYDNLVGDPKIIGRHFLNSFSGYLEWECYENHCNLI